VPDRTRVREAWHHIHRRHPAAYRIAFPGQIGRLKYRDFPRLLLRTCRLAPDARILEAGCGSGRDSLFFSSCGFRCVAADADVTPLHALLDARAALRVRRGNKVLSLDVLAADIFSLPFSDQAFDLVFSSGVIEHFDTPTRAALLAEMQRVTRHGGFVVLLFPNTDHLLYSWWRRLISRFTDFDRYNIPELPIGATIATEVASQGLDLVLCDWIDCSDTLSHYPSWLPLRILAFAATTVLPRPPRRLRRTLGTRTLVIARKVLPAATRR
jgi:SAM-dependent methyltransferase